MNKRLTQQSGGIIWSTLKLMVFLVLAFLLTRTNKHLDAKYEQAPPPSTAVNPVAPPPPKEK